MANRVTVELVYFSGANPPPESGVILDQSMADISAYEFSPPPPWAWTTATATWANPNPNDLNASQHQGNTTGYHLRAIPYWKTSIPYQFAGGGTYFEALALGQITPESRQ
jgi:hypothetical protein